MKQNKQEYIDEDIRLFESLYCMQTIIPEIESQNNITEFLKEKLSQAYERGRREIVETVFDRLEYESKYSPITLHSLQDYKKVIIKNLNK